MLSEEDIRAKFDIRKVVEARAILKLPPVVINMTSLRLFLNILIAKYKEASPEVKEQIERLVKDTTVEDRVVAPQAVAREADVPQVVARDIEQRLNAGGVLRTDKIEIESMDSFIKQFQVSQYDDIAQIDALNRLIETSANALGKGGMGVVFDIPGTDYVVKKMAICEGYNTGWMCNMFKTGSIVYKIPFTPTNKTLAMAPNYISEVIIGMILSKKSPGFVDINRFYFTNTRDESAESNHLFVIMEKLMPDIRPKLTCMHELLYFTLQIFQALSVAQNKFSFVHGDLHLGNVLPRQYPADSNLKCYDVGNGKFLYTYFDHDNVITDFGFSRLETDNTIIIPRIELDDKASDNFVFNPYLDIFSVLTFLFYKAGCSPEYEDTYKGLPSPETQAYIRELFKAFFGGKDVDEAFIQSNAVVESGDHRWFWRPDPAKLYESARDSRLFNASNMFEHIADTIEKMQQRHGTAVPEDITNHEKILEWLREHKFYVTNARVDFGGKHVHFIDREPAIGNPYFSPVVLTDLTELADKYTKIDDLIEIRYYSKFDLSPRNKLSNYNLVAPPSVVNGPRDFTDQNIYVAQFNQSRALRQGYSYRFDCCNVDPREYFKTTKFESGIVVNSVYFDIFATKTPIGFYKTRDITIDANAVPELYRKYYSFVGINQHGKLEMNVTNPQAYEQIFAAGATIMKDGVPVFTEETITETTTPNEEENEEDAQFLFLAGPKGPGPVYKLTLKTINGVTAKLKNVENIKPGEMLHAGNPNPRTLLGISKDGETVYFIRIEGREKRGVGMDFVQMGILCQRLGIHNALNLDGGRSSQMCWKNPGDPTINVAGISLNSYPVGAVMSLVKTR